MVIDPLIDANTGAQTVSTAKMGDELEALGEEGLPLAMPVTPLTRNTLATKPLLLIGTLTPVNVERSIDKQPDAFRVWLTLIDLRSGKVVAKALDRATVDSVNPEPLPFYRDSPTWHKDKPRSSATSTRARSTPRSATRPIPSTWRGCPPPRSSTRRSSPTTTARSRSPTGSTRKREPIADPGDLRVLNGLYITSWQLGKKRRGARRVRQAGRVGPRAQAPADEAAVPARHARTFITSRRPAAAVLDLARLAGPAGRPHAGLRAHRRPHQPHRQRARQRAAVAAARRGGAEDARARQPRPVVEAERRRRRLEGGAGRARAPTTCATRSTGGWSSGSSTASETRSRRRPDIDRRRATRRDRRECARAARTTVERCLGAGWIAAVSAARDRAGLLLHRLPAAARAATRTAAVSSDGDRPRRSYVSAATPVGACTDWLRVDSRFGAIPRRHRQRLARTALRRDADADAATRRGAIDATSSAAHPRRRSRTRSGSAVLSPQRSPVQRLVATSARDRTTLTVAATLLDLATSAADAGDYLDRLRHHRRRLRRVRAGTGRAARPPQRQLHGHASASAVRRPDTSARPAARQLPAATPAAIRSTARSPSARRPGAELQLHARRPRTLIGRSSRRSPATATSCTISNPGSATRQS